MSTTSIIGGGISGLSCASWLPDALLFEKSEHVGGWVRTISHSTGIPLELAANGWLNNEPAVDRLLAALDLQDQVLPASPEQKIRWIYNQNLVALPSAPPNIFRSPLLSFWSKIRLLWEPFVGRNKNEKEESVAEFVSRRLGSGVINHLLAPMTAGIFAAQPEELSLRAAFPKMFEMEEEHGSLLRALLKRGKSSPPRLCSLKNGSGVLCQTIAHRLSDRLQTQKKALSLDRIGNRWRIHFEDGEHESDTVVLSCPAYAQASILRANMPILANHLDQIQYSSVVLAISIYPRSSCNPRGFGALVSRDAELHGALGVLFSSSIFPTRVPEDYTVTRTILGGTRYPKLIDLPEEELKERVASIHHKLFGATNPKDILIFKHHNAIPLYEVGHYRRQNAISAILQQYPGLFLLGNHLFGVGVKDCIRNGEQTAQRVKAYLQNQDSA
ncbi:MAG: protoporphyrinogen oxidase [Myxococcota bacterium]|nr:protoporphyrinogen oxidase [Myxococcota bacterium]